MESYADQRVQITTVSQVFDAQKGWDVQKIGNHGQWFIPVNLSNDDTADGLWYGNVEDVVSVGTSSNVGAKST